MVGVLASPILSAKRNTRTHCFVPRPHDTNFLIRYEERALGVLQAMVELNIRPCTSAVSMDTLVSYWDSESPRIGDVHPSRAGISQWRETANTASAKPPGSTPPPGQEQSVRLMCCYTEPHAGHTASGLYCSPCDSPSALLPLFCCLVGCVIIYLESL